MENTKARFGTTYIFKKQPGQSQIFADIPEWRERHPVTGDAAMQTLDILQAWDNGTRRTSIDEMPRELIPEKPCKSWPDGFQTINGLLVVSGSAKDVIEDLDPDVHQFFPLTIRTKRGVEVEGPWFSLVVTAKQDSIVMEKSRVLVSARAPDRLCSFYSSTQPADIVVDPARQSGLNLWREARFVSSLLGSQALIDAIQAANLKFFGVIRTTDAVTFH